ncbi:MAG TPA: galactokinase [Gemmatimonadales bacterium]|nr:galactokinase [Gemmatimonadales bacterium]
MTYTSTRATALDAAFRNVFGASDPSPVHAVQAPGRVNLIGEHIDYCSLSVFPMALRQGIRIAFQSRPDRESRLVNRDPRFAPVTFTVGESIPPASAGDWGNYARAAAQAVAHRFPNLRGVNALVESDLPVAAGLSSSSALVVATALALLFANQVTLAPLELMELLARGERYVGTAGGGMDQAIILGAQAGCASRIDFNPLRLTAAAVPAEWRFLVASSMVQAEKSAGARQAYNDRTRACDAARRLVAARLGRPPDTTYPALLATASVEQLLDVAAGVLSGALLRRFRHVVTEATRVHQAETAMTRAAGDMTTFGQLLDASHRSLRDDYEVSHPELDRLVELAREAGAAGARLTGAGFGGCVVVLARAERAPDVLAALRERFYAPRGAASDIGQHLFTAEPAAGASVLDLEP